LNRCFFAAHGQQQFLGVLSLVRAADHRHRVPVQIQQQFDQFGKLRERPLAHRRPGRGMDADERPGE
jgi:hypothetical protein